MEALYEFSRAVPDRILYVPLTALPLYADLFTSRSPNLVLPAIREGSLLLAPTRSQRLRYADELRVHGKDRVNLTLRQSRLVYEWKVSLRNLLFSTFEFCLCICVNSAVLIGSLHRERRARRTTFSTAVRLL